MYPKGTRIQIERMNDPYHPVERGTKGTVDYVDDAGTLHCIFDNGRTLGVVSDADIFHVIDRLNTFPLLSVTLVFLALQLTATRGSITFRRLPSLSVSTVSTAMYESRLWRVRNCLTLLESISTGFLIWNIVRSFSRC